MQSAGRDGGLAPALHPRVTALERVEGAGVLVRAIRTGADVVAQDPEVRDAPDMQEVQAMRHVIVLPPGFPWELCAALPAALGVGDHRKAGKDFHRAEHHGEVRRVRELVAVHD
eukprot:CAMPEP_0170387704 /NCGR_PEP_ID=MMETSP0117_2-20130122/17697_1 /TAXON_ID=400756 /ORGANISM="Durinskia baltica, Strain CSIRO CS-38" /LENGTH=113 /DNA_ID=CAMNT_0010643585 /DNA_START=469 /DNA_END=807 /DNA_ORIENTATION=+